jgi:hypothetical protein
VETKHIPPQGQSLIGLHNTTGTGQCLCGPTKRTVYKPSATGRGGRHQGNKIARIEIIHEVI